ncbi:MAG: hypothetical protein ACTSVC_12405 [Promethearchaeota archaeon]
MVNLYLVGLNYAGDVSESDYIVFQNEKEATQYIKAAAVKVMITTVVEESFQKLIELSQKNFNKKPEDITNEDVDNLDTKTLESFYKALLKLQDKRSGVTGYFVEKVEYFTDPQDKKYKITLSEIDG